MSPVGAEFLVHHTFHTAYFIETRAHILPPAVAFPASSKLQIDPCLHVVIFQGLKLEQELLNSTHKPSHHTLELVLRFLPKLSVYISYHERTMSTIPVDILQSGNPPVIPLPFNGGQPERVTLYPLSNYTFGVKETQPEEDPSVIARLKRLEEHFAEHGMRRTCEGILVCHEHNHPHILMLQIANAFFKLPGDYLRPEDDEISGFKARLDERLAPVGRIGEGEENGDWTVGECLAQWWRPNFETFMYPFVPAHVTRPKECKKLYFIHLPKTSEYSSENVLIE